ncbi:fibronectin type III domain-containing protein [Arthrobacter sulfonylureivorans]|uniref:Fibronectin type III domain-containing protein n=1 Tax=Arthrobacter sulfonylureivorans TaxID=2486855 RepID=A0ABY3WAF4_9MICC|nr:fibronectin type III domain-containing protein [Arthrobacter sulfonylureivorans]UNK47322.1 fibronectin type III domain-containing protein [Arthrobacter sulfonylureivorans]
MRPFDHLAWGLQLTIRTWHSKGTALISTLAVLLACGVAPAAAATSTSRFQIDTSAPTLHSYEITSGNIDASKGGTVTARLHITDATCLDGMPTLMLDNAIGNSYGSWMSVSRVSGDCKDGVYVASAQVFADDLGSQPFGEWSTILFPLRDTLGNSAGLYSNSFFAHRYFTYGLAPEAPASISVRAANTVEWSATWSEPESYGSPIRSYRVSLKNVDKGITVKTFATTTPGCAGCNIALEPNTRYQLAVIALNGMGESASRNSSVFSTATVFEPPVVNTVKPSISGKTTQGQTLTVSPGSWTSGTTLTYQWVRNGAAISGGNEIGYSLTSDDLGKRITVTVTGSKPGHKSASATTPQTAVITQDTVSNSKRPAISGKAIRSQTLKASTGSWTAGTKLSYQWKRDGQTIKGATRSSYKLATADVGKRVTLTVTGTKTHHKSRAVTTAKTAKVVNPKLSNSKRPTISGTPKVGKKLTAKAGKWTSGSKYSYQWLRAGQSIKGAAKSSYKLSAKDRGKKISVKVTAEKPGYISVSVTSKSTAKVK